MCIPSSDHEIESIGKPSSEGGRLDEEAAAAAAGELGWQSHVRTTAKLAVERTMMRFKWAVAMKVVPGEKATIDDRNSCEKSYTPDMASASPEIKWLGFVDKLRHDQDQSRRAGWQIMTCYLILPHRAQCPLSPKFRRMWHLHLACAPNGPSRHDSVLPLSHLDVGVGEPCQAAL